MGLPVTILGVAQDMDFETGNVSNLLSIGLADGTILRALVDDDSAAQVIQQFVKGGSTVTPASVPTYSRPTATTPVVHATIGNVSGAAFDVATLDDGSEAHIFGGGSVMAEESPPPPTPVPAVRRKAPVVQADERGYPIIVDRNGVDPRDVTGLNNHDEDGISSV